MFKKICLLAFALLGTFSLWAHVRLPVLFGDNMVLQRDKPIAVWGWSDGGEKVTVQFNRQSKATKADKKGHWMIHLDPEPAGGPFQLIVKGKDQVTLSNVLVGEVWICSGQSNMEMPIEGWGKINNYLEEIAAADYPSIRHFKVPNTVSTTPKDDLPGGDWKICSRETAGNFSATAYFFARELVRQLHVPVGLINTSWGGTHVETWTSRGAFEQSEEFKSMIATLPSGDGLTAAAGEKKAALLKTITTLQGSLPAMGEEAQYKDAAYADDRWAHMKLPGLWEQAGLGLNDLDGIVWFRKTIGVAEEDAGKPAVLELGKIDDADEAYINGVKVGATKGYNEARHYTIPAGVLKAGKNVIAVRVEDTGGGGGIYGEPGELSFTIAGKTIPLAGDWSFRIVTVSISNSVNPNNAPTLLFNAMVSPLIPYTIRGAIWYQGEANAGRAYQYRKAFPLLITDWRGRWGLGDFPFYFVELSSWNANNGNSAQGSTWAELREAQAMTLALPNTGMAVTTDIGNSKDIHPKDKQDVGWRLAAIALNNCYGQKAEYSGPVYQSMQTEGNKIILTFTHTGSGLVVHDKYGYLKGFEIAGSDQQFYYARAMVQGDKVVVWQDGVSAPTAIRYGWADDAGEGNFFNKEGFPASPFRTDQWKGITEEGKYEVGK
ncbi:MAG TPA: sialate O-acetylesterase [Puia sp.]